MEIYWFVMFLDERFLWCCILVGDFYYSVGVVFMNFNLKEMVVEFVEKYGWECLVSYFGCYFFL